MIRIAQIGCGYWGPNLLRNFYRMEEVEVKYVVEVDPGRIQYVKANYKDIKVVDDYQFVLKNGGIDAVVIATPAHLHYQQARDALLLGKHCFIEKPLSMRTVDAKELVSIAESNGRKLMIGHVFLYNSAVRKLKEEIRKGTLGDVYYIYSQRLNLGRIRKDVNAMWNFAPHDVSIFLYLIDSKPQWASAVGACYVQPDVEDVVFLTIGFRNGVVANAHISWLDPNKVRKMTVVGTKQMIVYDDVADYKIQIYDKGIEKVQVDHPMGNFDSFGKFQLIHRAGDLLIPKIDYQEPLATETAHFIEAIREDKNPLTDGYHGMEVTRILEAATKSLQDNGKRIELNHDL